ncbi:MAG: hypothetical protein B5M51_06815, partial [Anaerolinea sp. 4484_236]
LSVGMEISDSVKELSRQMDIELNEYGFCHTTLFDPLQTSRPGIYVAGPFREPKDISESVTEATGTAAKVAELLAPALVADYAKSLPNVVHAEDNLYTCSQDTIAHITDQVKELGLTRVVVASCSPITHEALFQDAIRQGGLNPYLFEMANIRNQCSWVHSDDWDTATEKAKSLVRMSVAKAAYLEALQISKIDVNNAALIIGGGTAGMTAALNLAKQGFPVHLVEREDELGGNLRHLRYFANTLGNGAGGNGKQGSSKLVNWETQSPDTPISQSPNFLSTTPKEYLAKTIANIERHPLITIHLNTELEYSYGQDERIIANDGRRAGKQKSRGAGERWSRRKPIHQYPISQSTIFRCYDSMRGAG